MQVYTDTINKNLTSGNRLFLDISSTQISSHWLLRRTNLYVCKLENRYRTTSWSSYNESLKLQGFLCIWLGKGMALLAGLNGKRGRTLTYSNTAIQLGLSLKC